MDYLELTINEDPRGGKLSLRTPDGREAHATVDNLPDADECERVIKLLATIRDEVGAPENAARVGSVEEFGKRLYRAAFPDQLRELLGGYLERGDDFGIRIDLARAGDLARAPWELLRHPDHEQFLALRTSPRVVLTRYLASSMRPPAPPQQGTLRMLVLLPQYSGEHRLDSDGEWEVLQRALLRLDAVRIEPIRLEPPVTWDKLQKKLNEAPPFHILHFGGHAAHDPASSKGSLFLEDESGFPDEIDCEDLADLLDDHKSLRLVMLNACEGGRLADGFAGLAKRLCQRGFPAVVAMQFPVTDDVAVEFTACFYRALIEGQPVDGAVHRARQAMRLGAARRDLQWATPVVYQQDNAVLFEAAERPRDVDPSENRSNGEKHVLTYYCDRSHQRGQAQEAIPEYGSSEARTGRPVVLVTHGDSLAEHWAFFKRIELEILPDLHWSKICTYKLPELLPGSAPESVARYIRRSLASKIGATDQTLEAVLRNRGGQALLIDLPCQAHEWRSKEESLLRDVYRCWSDFGDLPAEMLLVCVLSVRYEPIPRRRRSNGPEAAMVAAELFQHIFWFFGRSNRPEAAMVTALEQANRPEWPLDLRVRWRVLPQFPLVLGSDVQMWNDVCNVGLHLTPEAMATKVFDLETEALRDLQKKGPSALAKYVYDLDISMQHLIPRLKALLEERQLKHGDARR